jgi:hypothetical protein
MVAIMINAAPVILVLAGKLGVVLLIRLLGFGSGGQGGRELRCIKRNPAPIVSLPMTM